MIMLKLEEKTTIEILKKVLREREENYVRLCIDLNFSQNSFPIEEEKKAQELKERIEEVEKKPARAGEEEPPKDWLAPKIFKGTSIS